MSNVEVRNERNIPKRRQPSRRFKTIKMETKNLILVKKNAGTIIKKNMAMVKLMMKERDISQLFGFLSSSATATSAENIRHLIPIIIISNKVMVPRMNIQPSTL